MTSPLRGFRGPNNFLLARRTFLYRNRTSFFRRRIDRCRCLDRSRCSKTIEKIVAFGICLPTSSEIANVVVSTPIRPMPMPRSIALPAASLRFIYTHRARPFSIPWERLKAAHCLRIYALLHVLLLLPPDPQPCQRRPIPTLASLPAPAFLLFLPLLFLPLFFYLHFFLSPPVFLHRDKFKAR